MENFKNKDWQKLIEEYLANSISKKDLDHFLQKIKTDEDSAGLLDSLQSYWKISVQENRIGLPDSDRKFAELMEQIRPAAPVYKLKNKKSRWIFFRAAAAVLIIVVAGYFIFLNKKVTEIAAVKTADEKLKDDLPPGTNGAILTLADGKMIVIDSMGNGTLAIQGKTKVINANGKIVYQKQGKEEQEALYNTISTPRGKQYELELGDGSKVWLNASSSIRFPASFTTKERKVEITGEAYFEVAHNAASPFRVKINNALGNGGEVEVLGTHFNISSYDDELSVNTTLLEGSVKVSNNGNTSLLKPGQQAQAFPAGNLKVINDIDIDAVMAWKNGFFSFNHADLTTIMRQIARWYDVDIVFEGAVPDRHFGGDISRNANASQVLKILEESKIHFRIEGRKIIVQP